MTTEELNAIVSSEEFGLVVKMIVEEGLRQMEARLNARINDLDANAIRHEASRHYNDLASHLSAALKGYDARIQLVEKRLPAYIGGDPIPSFASALADMTALLREERR